MSILDHVTTYHEDLTTIRRDIHAHPEVGFEEHRTSDIVADLLEGWGIEVHRGLGKTGVVGTLRVGNSNHAKTIGLRADMDALPMDEYNEFAHKSTIPGKMHACGHDGHTTMLLGAARYLAETRNFEGTVHFIFQPAEEGVGGAKAMVEDGLFDKFPCDFVYGMHNAPGLPVGQFAIKPKVMMAGGALFDVYITGKGAHGARPESSIDPIVVAAQIVNAAQSIVARNVPPQQTAVLSFTQIHAGNAYNIIPHEAQLMGTVRCFENEVMEQVETNLRRTVEMVAASMGAEATLDFRIVFLPTFNDPTETEFSGDIAASLVGEEAVNRDREIIMASEDFSFMLAEVPGAYINIGNGPGEQVHHPRYDFNDEILPLGSTYFASLIEEKLKKD